MPSRHAVLRIKLDHRIGVAGSRANGLAGSNGLAVVVHTGASGSTMAMAVVLLTVQDTTTAALAPTGLAGEDSIVQLSLGTVVKSLATVQGNVVEAEVPDGSVGHAVRGEGKGDSDGGTGEDVIPVVELVNSERATDEDGTKDGDVGDDQLPHGGVVVGKDLEFGVEVQVEVAEAGEGSGGVSTGETLERVVDLLHIAGANLLGNVQALESSGAVSGAGDATLASSDTRQIGLASLEEVRAQATDEELDEDLENGGANEGVEKADDSVVDVPEGADADLHEKDDADGDDGSEEGSKPNGNDFVAHRVGKLRVDNFTIGEGDGERTVRGRRCHVYSETDSTHTDHGDNVDEGALEPLPEAGTGRHGVRLSAAALAGDAVMVTVGVAGGSSACGRRLTTFSKDAHGDAS